MTSAGGQAKPFQWTNESTTILINLYEVHPNLYNTNNPQYKLKTKRQDSFRSIRQELFEVGFDVTIEDINKKIHGLRTQFFKELGKVKKCAPSGSASTDTYISKWWCYDMLAFLMNSDHVRESQSNIENINPQEDMATSSDLLFDGTLDELENSELRLDETERVHVSQPKRQKVTLQKQAMNIMQNASEVLSTVKSEDVLLTFAKSVANELKNIKDEAKLRKTKQDIFNLVIDAQET